MIRKRGKSSLGWCLGFEGQPSSDLKNNQALDLFAMIFCHSSGGIAFYEDSTIWSAHNIIQRNSIRICMEVNYSNLHKKIFRVRQTAALIILHWYFFKFPTKLFFPCNTCFFFCTSLEALLLVDLPNLLTLFDWVSEVSDWAFCMPATVWKKTPDPISCRGYAVDVGQEQEGERKKWSSLNKVFHWS